MDDCHERTIKQAGHTRWLSHLAALTSLRDCYSAIIADLHCASQSEKVKINGNAPTAGGLYKKLTKYETIAIIHFLCDALRPVNMLTLFLEKNDINVAEIKPRVDSTLSTLENLKRREGSSAKKCTDVLLSIGTIPTSSEKEHIKATTDKFLDSLCENIKNRMASTEVLEHMDVFKLQQLDPFYGNAEMDDLATHFQLDQDQTQDEWNTLKEALVTSTPDAYQGPRALMKTLLKLRTIMGPLRNIEKLCAASLVIPVSNAEVERVFSEVKRIKTDLRNRLQTDTVNQLLTIHRNDRHLNFDSAVNRWHTTKPRRV